MDMSTIPKDLYGRNGGKDEKDVRIRPGILKGSEP